LLIKPIFKCTECKHYFTDPKSLKYHISQHEMTITDKANLVQICRALDEAIKRGILTR